MKAETVFNNIIFYKICRYLIILNGIIRIIVGSFYISIYMILYIIKDYE